MHNNANIYNISFSKYQHRCLFIETLVEISLMHESCSHVSHHAISNDLKLWRLERTRS